MCFLILSNVSRLQDDIRISPRAAGARIPRQGQKEIPKHFESLHKFFLREAAHLLSLEMVGNDESNDLVKRTRGKLEAWDFARRQVGTAYILGIDLQILAEPLHPRGANHGLILTFLLVLVEHLL
jgi:hypothetical protein